MSERVPLRYATANAPPQCEGFLLAKWKTLLPFPRKKFFFVLSGTMLTCQDSPYSPVVWEDDIADLDLAVRKSGRDAELVLEDNKVILLRLVALTIEDFSMWFSALRKTCKASFDKFYQLGEKIGKGHYAQVFLARDKTTKDAFAVKVLDKRHLSNKPKFIEREKDIMRHVAHPNVVRTYDLFETHDRCYIVMEHCRGGRLFDALLKVKQFTETEAQLVMDQILKGVAYLHRNCIAHRDIKAENILLSRPTTAGFASSELEVAPPGLLKISDFGLSRRINSRGEEVNLSEDADQEALLKSCAGTPQYIAPEILLRQPYSFKADVWSLGVLLYVLLSGTYPFMADNVTGVLEKVASAEVTFPKRQWDTISPEACKLVQKMLSYSPSQRPSIRELQACSWIVNGRYGSRRPSWVSSMVTNSADSSIAESKLATR